ncbi:MAG TPA: RsmE family RNA methyltransferase [Actinomycetota bacterium]|nr:RsmE family RNA methyltransferase [Actinomycetota bacterium]
MTAGRHHFFTQPDLIGEQSLVLRGPDAHHAKVLRLGVGETISVADGTGRVVDAVVTRAGSDEVEARVVLVHELRPHRPVLVLWQALVKRESMDEVVQKAVEVGARRVVPFAAERSIVRWDAEKRERLRDRWEQVALAAAKQSRSPWLTVVDPVEDGLSAVEDDAGPILVLHERAETHFRDALPAALPHTVTIVIGPEGGLTDDEVDAVTGRGGTAVTLGDRILRTETAGAIGLALASYAYGVMG